MSVGHVARSVVGDESSAGCAREFLPPDFQSEVDDYL